jgi:glucose/arabinose dehydrogenase
MKRIFLFAIVVTGSVIGSNCGSQKGVAQAGAASPEKIQLPAPSESVRKNSKVIGWTEGKKPVAPEGFEVTKFADGLNSPRWIYVAPNGDVLVSQAKTNKEQSPNNILLFRDTDKDGNVDMKETLITGLNQPLGMLIQNNFLYVGNTDGIYRYPYTAGRPI